MPPKDRLLLMMFRVVAMLPIARGASAADGVWTDPGGGAWPSGGNWRDSAAAGGRLAVADFSTLDLHADATVLMNGDHLLGGVVFGDAVPSHDWSLRKGLTGILTLDAGGASPVIRVKSGTSTIGVDLSGGDGLTKRGAGTLVLAGAGVYQGETRIREGTLRLGAPPVFPAGMRVYPLGDSITYGHDGANAGYRGLLYSLLLPAVPDLLYVGTSTERPGLLPGAPVNQRHHEGHSSYSIWDVDRNLDGFDNTTFLIYGGAERNPNGGYWLVGGNGTGRAPIEPDLITLMIGTNDLDELAGIHTRLHHLIGKITTLRPSAKLLAARITPVAGLAAVAECNAAVDATVDEFQAAGGNIRLVDLNTAFPANGLIADGVHPNDTGFSWMAMQWYEGILRAFSPYGGTTQGIPAGSAVTVSAGAMLDLAGTRAAMASLYVAGTLDLGHGGELNASRSVFRKTGVLSGSGVIHGEVVLNGPTIGGSGQLVRFSGNVANNGLFQPSAGSSIVFESPFVNNGVVTLGPGVSVAFGGGIVNNGVVRLVGGASLEFEGAFVNNGTFDILTGARVPPAGMENHGWILDGSAVRLESFSPAPGGIHLEIGSYSGHVYQLQRSETLAEGSWLDAGPSKPGVTGVTLGFDDPREDRATRSFYRIKVSP